MSSNLGNLVATATLDIAPFMANTRTMNMALRGLDKSLNAMEKSFKNAGKGSQGLSGMKAILSETGKSLEAYRLNLAKQTEHYNNLKKEIGDVSTATAAQKTALLGAKSAMSDTIAKVAELQAKYVTLAREINIQSSAWTKAGTALYDMGSKFQSAGQKLSGVGSALTKGVTAPLVAGAGIAIKAAIDYESAFAGVKKTVDETATVSYAKLSNGIRQMAKELPASAVEIANVAEVAGQLGIKTEDILKFSRTMIDMGESTNLSAEEAATAIAKVANIMGLSSDDYSRFGASVVDLGNNFATTEKDIVEMTNRLAAGGRLAGLTAPDILGLATAMSSVGIEAEAGGTAMTQTLTAIGNAVSLTGKGAAEKLELIANTAGMTAEQFQQAWKEKPVQALQAFIKGLENAHKSGENVNGILDDLDMKGIRQSNMLKSLALASDKMSSAVDRSNRAWKENTALTNEANKRYATTESQLKMFKNQLTDIAIEFGGPLLQALRNGLDAAKPWITNLADMAKAFNNMSTEQQQSIIKWGLLAAAIGPTLKLLGGGLSILGGFMKAIGGASKAIGQLVGTLKTIREVGSVAGGLKAVTAGITETGAATTALGTATATASGSTTLLGQAIAALGGPLGLMIGGIGLVTAGLVYLGNEKDKARIKTEEFGTQLSETARSDLRSFQKVVDETSNTVANFGTHAGDADKVAGSFKKLYEEVVSSADKANKRLQELADKWGISPEKVAKAQEYNNQMVSNTEAIMNQINDIYQRHNGDASKFSQEEKEIIINNQREMISAKLELMNLSAKEQKAVLQALNGDIITLNETQLKHSRESLEKAMKEENSLYKESKAELKEMLSSKLLTRQEYNAKMKQLESEHNQTMEALGTKYLEVMKTLDDKVKLRTGQSWNYWEEAKKLLEDYGLSYEEIGEKASKAAREAGNSHSILAKYSSEMSATTKEANDAWSLLVGNINKNNQFEVKSNVKEVIGEAVKSAEGWEQLKFIAKEAELNTNARATIAEALVESGKWAEMPLEEKKLIVQNQAGLQAIFDSQQHLAIWNSLPAETKQLLMNNQDVMNKADVAKQALENYNKLTPQQKELLARDEEFRKVVSRSTESLKNWDMANPFPKDLLVNGDNALLNTGLSIAKLDMWNQAATPTKELKGDSTSAVTEIGKAIGAAWNFNNLTVPTKNLNGDSTSAVVEVGKAIGAVNNFIGTEAPTKPLPSDATPTQNASNQAIGAVNSFNNTLAPTKLLTGDPSSVLGASSQGIGGLNSFNGTPTPTKHLTAVDNTSGVAWGVIGVLNSIPRTITTVIQTVRSFIGHEKGTNFHEGGPAMVNDQRGTLYKEMVTLPDGTSFIPEGRNVILPLPRGSKVLKAGLTRNLMNSLGMPLYADGIGWENTKVAKITQRIKNINEWKRETEERDLASLMEELLKETRLGNRKTTRPNQNYTLNVSGQGGTRELTPEFMQRLIRELAYYTRQEGGRMT